MYFVLPKRKCSTHIIPLPISICDHTLTQSPHAYRLLNSDQTTKTPRPPASCSVRPTHYYSLMDRKGREERASWQHRMPDWMDGRRLIKMHRVLYKYPIRSRFKIFWVLDGTFVVFACKSEIVLP